MPRYRPSSTSDMLAGLIYKGKTIKRVDKLDGRRKLYFTDGTNLTVPKAEVAALARIKGSMSSAEAIAKLSPWERKQRMEKTLQRKETSIQRDRAKFIKDREYVGKIAQKVEGVPSIKLVRRRGVNIPVMEGYFSKKVDVKAVAERIRASMGDKWKRKFMNYVREVGMSVSQAVKKLMEEFQSKGE